MLTHTHIHTHTHTHTFTHTHKYTHTHTLTHILVHMIMHIHQRDVHCICKCEHVNVHFTTYIYKCLIKQTETLADARKLHKLKAIRCFIRCRSSASLLMSVRARMCAFVPIVDCASVCAMWYACSWCACVSAVRFHCHMLATSHSSADRPAEISDYSAGD